MLSKIVSTRGRSIADVYSRTQNENGTYNTRCLYCFMTVASAVESDGELERLETGHICPEKALARLQELEMASKPETRETTLA